MEILHDVNFQLLSLICYKGLPETNLKGNVSLYICNATFINHKWCTGILVDIKFVLACHPWGVSTCRFVCIFHFILKHFKYPFFFDGITLRPTTATTDLYKPTQNTKDDNPARLPVFICMYLKGEIIGLDGLYVCLWIYKPRNGISR